MVSRATEASTLESYTISSILQADGLIALTFSPAKANLPESSIKLASKHYLLWKVQLVLVLHGHDLLVYVTMKCLGHLKLLLVLMVYDCLTDCRMMSAN